MLTRLPSTFPQYVDCMELGRLPSHEDTLPPSLASHQAVSHQKEKEPPLPLGSCLLLLLTLEHTPPHPPSIAPSAHAGGSRWRHTAN